MRWLFPFIYEVIADLPDDLNTTVTTERKGLEAAVVERYEQESFFGNKKTQQWL